MTPTTLQCAGRPPAAATSVAVKTCVLAIVTPVRLAQPTLGDEFPAAAAGNAAKTIAANAVPASSLVRPQPTCPRQSAEIFIALPPETELRRPHDRLPRWLSTTGYADQDSLSIWVAVMGWKV